MACKWQTQRHTLISPCDVGAMENLKIGALAGFVFLAISVSAQTDSTFYYDSGNISNQQFNLEEIQVRPTCECIGDCSCGMAEEGDSAENRFSCTEEVLAKNGRISLIKRGNFAFEPVLNGMASDRINLTIDGMRIFAACTDKMDPVTSYVEPNNMQSFSVHHGVSGSMYGSNIGGSVNMKTVGAVIRPNQPISGEIGGGIQSSAGGVNGLMSLNYSQKKWAVAANGVYRKFGSYRAGGGAIIPYTQFEKWNGSISGKVLLSDKDLLRADVIIDEGYNIGYAALPMDVEYAKARIFGVTYQRSPALPWFDTFELKAYGNHIAHNMDDTHRDDVVMHMDMPGWSTTYGAHMDAKMSFGSHQFTARLDGYHNNTLAEMTMYPSGESEMFMLTWPDINKLSGGLYLQDDIRLNDRRSLGLNFRLEYVRSNSISDFGARQASVFGQDISSFDNRWLKNGSISYRENFTSSLSGWFTAGYAERAPSITEQYAFYIFNAYDGFDYIGNVDLKTEKALQGDIGALWKREKLSLKATGFFYQIFDYILGAIDPALDAMTIGANGVKQSVNISSAYMTGGAVEFNWSLAKQWQLANNTSFTYGNTFEGDALPLVPPLRNATSLRWNHSRGYIAVEAEAVAAQQRINPDFGETTTPSYGLLHLRSGYTFPIGKQQLTLNAGVENILDTYYRTHLTWGGIPQPGINGYLNVSFAF